MERRDYKQNSVCSAIFYYLENKTNKQKSGDILMPLEAFTATKSFMHIFELCTIMHKASLPVSHSHRNGTHPGNHSTHVFHLPWTHLWKVVSCTHFNNCKLPSYEKWLALWTSFLSTKKPISSRFTTHKILFVTKEKRKLEFWWCYFTHTSKMLHLHFFLIFQRLCLNSSQCAVANEVLN